MPHDDFEIEPVKGLPERPPEGEVILWQGRPDWWALARESLNLYWVAAYFVGLALWRTLTLYDITGWGYAFRVSTPFLILGAIVCALLIVIAFVQARATVYTITNKRVVIRHGVTLPMAVNIPFTKVALAASKIRPDGSGDISISLLDGNRVSWFAVWPHKRPWSWQATTPALRSVADAASVAKILSDALAVHVAQEGDAYQASPPKIVRTKPRVSAISAAAARVEPDYRTADA
jgi:hypothetical protein